MTSLHPTQLTIDLAAIRHNYREVAKRLHATQQIICVIKSNAYGHGLTRVAASLADEGAAFFGVRDLDEGMALRQAGIRKPILLLLGIIDEAFEALVEHQLTPVLFDLEIARSFNDYLKARDIKHRVHIKIDTGMTRLGVPADKVLNFFTALRDCPQLEIEGVLTHLADATNASYTAQQTELFNKAHRELIESSWNIPYWHGSNSIGALRNLFPQTELVRAGIVLYGSYPDASLADEIQLRPAMRWTTEILDLKEVPSGTAVSYGCTYITKRPSRIAVLPVGYADGYPRLLSNRGSVLVQGQRAPIAGRVCMDLTMVDVSDIPSCQVGDRVTLLGSDGNDNISAEEMATWAETISYEIHASIASRVPRHYQE